jgi:PAS domain S-box-containing protein
MQPSPPAMPWQIPAVAYLEHFHVGGSYLRFGPQIERLLGWPSPQIGSPGFWKRLLHPEDRDRVLAEDEQVELTRRPWANTYRIAAQDGRFVALRDEAVLLTDSAGEPQFWQGVLLDVTGYQRMQAEAAERLHVLDEAKSTFLTALNHELRTPLATILGMTLTLQQLGRRLSQQETSELLARLGANARKLERMLSDLLAVNQRDQLDRRDDLPLDRRPVDLPTLVEQAATQWRGRHRRPLAVDVDPIVAHLDAAMTRRILEALLVNVAQHTPPDTPVWVRVRGCGRDVLFTVEDAGPGVPAELHDLVFEPFQRGPGAPAHAPGLGIGLAVVTRLAERHGGHAWVRERVGGGACFHVLLPASPRDVP